MTSKPICVLQQLFNGLSFGSRPSSYTRKPSVSCYGCFDPVQESVSLRQGKDELLRFFASNWLFAAALANQERPDVFFTVFDEPGSLLLNLLVVLSIAATVLTLVSILRDAHGNAPLEL